MASPAEHLERLQHTLARLSDQHQRFVAISEMALNGASLDEVVHRILELLREAVPYDTGAFYWMDAGRRALRRSARLP